MQFARFAHDTVFTLEKLFKKPVFDCHECGQCILHETGYTCPMTCPKNLRNGPCGGSQYGKCEVYPEMDCVWVTAYERARALGQEHHLATLQPPVDWSLHGTASWINTLTGRDAVPYWGRRPVKEHVAKPGSTNHH